MADLLPCPFCGSLPQTHAAGPYFFAGCGNMICEVSPTVETTHSAEHAARLWNTRAPITRDDIEEPRP